MSKHQLALDNSQVPEGYKQTEVGVIPEDWEVTTLGEIGQSLIGLTYKPDDIREYGTLVLRSSNIHSDRLAYEDQVYVDSSLSLPLRGIVEEGDILICVRNGSRQLIGKCAMIDSVAAGSAFGAFMSVFRTKISGLVFYQFKSDVIKKQIKEIMGATINQITSKDMAAFQIPLPRSDEEQRAIAQTLSDVDGLIAALDQVIAKKRNIKTATMQELLTGKKRLPGFDGEWEVKTVEDIADCLDNIRVPLNESQRNRMKGNIPYCGANEILDYVNDFIVDDDIILMAEDGGYFDEFDTCPIAYRMFGKCWVNNHAHILKAKDHVSQGFLFYSLEHKDIRKFLASGTRTKLNKSEMEKIQIEISYNLMEQQAIATILSDMDAEIAALEKRRAKTQAMKQGMMQELLTGKTRLIDPNNP